MSDGKLSRLASKDTATLPTTTGALSRLAVRRAMQSGHAEVASLLRKTGLPAELASGSELRVDARGQIVFLNMLADTLQDPLLGFHLARDTELREVDPFYYLLASSDRLGDAFDYATRFCAVVNEAMRFTATRGATALSVEFGYSGVKRHIDRHQIEFWMTCTLKAARQFLNRELVPSYVGIVHQRDGDVSEMERYFGCAIEFGAMLDRIHFEPQEADMPIVTADPYLNRFMASYYETVAAQRHWRHNPLRTRVENAISPRLPHAGVSIATIASDLGMSTRTLSRRLSDEGLTFSSILDELRLDLADRYLQSNDLSVSQIAWLLGYTELSSFVHAYQRWTGRSPTDARRAIRLAAGSSPDSPRT